MVRRLIRSFLFWLLVGPKPTMPPVSNPEPEPAIPCSHGGCSCCSCDPAPGTPTGPPGEPTAPGLSHLERTIGVPVARVLQRETEILAALKAASVLPDLACVLALRNVHDLITRENIAQGWLLDREPEGGVH